MSRFIKKGAPRPVYISCNYWSDLFIQVIYYYGGAHKCNYSEPYGSSSQRANIYIKKKIVIRNKLFSLEKW